MKKSFSFNNTNPIILVYAAFIAGLCSIIYELLIATTTSYFLGDSVKYFSLTIGIYMASMGLGSFISKYINGKLLQKFIIIELMLGLFGGISVPALYFFYAFTDIFIFGYIFFTMIIGILVGLEIPFLTRLMQNYNQLKFNIANILSFDYLGALIATISFPFIFLPFLGVYQSSLIFGFINMSISFAILWFFSHEIGNITRKLKTITIMVTILIAIMIVSSEIVLKEWDNKLYADRIIYSKQTRYQKIVLTKHRNDIRLFLNGNLQFSSIDEYRYHETLIHVPISLHDKPIKRVLLLGAGDGMAARELLKYDLIEEIVIVDLDKAIIEFAKKNNYLLNLNKNSLKSPKIKIEISDAFAYLAKNPKLFDFIVADLPDPNNDILARLYSKQFYKLVRYNLAEDGLFVTQATSPYFAKKAFWSIVKTISAAGFYEVYPYHAQIPSFGDWGFVMASSGRKDIKNPDITVKTKFLDKNNLTGLFTFEKDIKTDKVEINTLDRPVLLNYYLRGWKYYTN